MDDYDQINRLLQETINISSSYRKKTDYTAENFNLFSILGMETDEVATHSRFIAELLNRKGSHGQGDKFLSNFLKIFAPDSKLNPRKSQVRIEYYIGKVTKESGGRIDILIRDWKDNIIMIENKVYAVEQHNQLLRYHRAFPKGKLIFLTLTGEESRQDSSKGLYESFSYDTDILNWLEKCKNDMQDIPPIKEIISQYINLVKKLTNQNLNKQMSKDIIAGILKDQRKLTAYKTLIDLNMDLKKELVKGILKRIQSSLDKNVYEIVAVMDFDKTKGRFIEIQTKSLKNRRLKLALSFENKDYAGLIFGFVKTEKIPEINTMALFEAFNELYPESKQSKLWYAYTDYREYKNWFYPTLNELYFSEENSFIIDLKSKIDELSDHIEENMDFTSD